MAALVRDVQNLVTTCEEKLDRWQLYPALRQQLGVIMGRGGGGAAFRALASNMAVRLALAERLIDGLEPMQREHPGRIFYHATFVDSRFETHSKAPVINLVPLEMRVRALLRDNGILDYIGAFELQPRTNWTRELGYSIDPHAHVIFWADASIDRVALEAKLKRSKRLVSLTGADTVRVTRWRRSAGSIAGLARYVMKPPERAKNRMASRTVEGAYVQRDAAPRPNLAVRMVEILSAFEAKELLFASGPNGKRLRADLVAHIRQIAFPTSRQDCDDAARIWREARDWAGKATQRPVEVVRRTKQSISAADPAPAETGFNFFLKLREQVFGTVSQTSSERS